MFTVGDPNFSADRVHTVPFCYPPFFSKDRLGWPHSVPYFFDRFPLIFSSKRESYRSNAMTDFRDFNIKKKYFDGVYYLKPDIYSICFALIIAYSSTVRALYKYIGLMNFKYGTVCAFDFLAENLWILRSIHAKPRAKPLIIVIENGRVRYGIMDKFG